jgi:glutamyl-tRNA reductase
VISATDAPGAIVHPADLARRDRGAARLVMIDLAVPRDIHPAVAARPGVEVYTVDDLRVTVEHALARRAAELPAAHSVVRYEIARFTKWLRQRELITI